MGRLTWVKPLDLGCLNTDRNCQLFGDDIQVDDVVIEDSRTGFTLKNDLEPGKSESDVPKETKV